MSMTLRQIARLGWKPDLPDTRDLLYHEHNEVLDAARLPAKVDLSPHMPPIVDQGQLGSCTGNGIARVLAHEALRQGESLTVSETDAGYSRLFIYYGERAIEGTISQDSGAEIRDGIKVVAQDGAPPESAWPYDITQFAVKPPGEVYAEAADHKAIVYQRVLPGGGRMRSALAAGLPIVFGFSVFGLFEDGSWNPATEVLPLPRPGDSMVGGHCVVISGYDFSCSEFPVPCFQVENSWGSGWGRSGRFLMDSRYFDPQRGLAQDLWVISRVS